MFWRKFSLHDNFSDHPLSELNAPISPDPEQLVFPSSGTAANGKPIFSWDQAAAQIDRVGAHWAASGGVVTVTYAFRSTAPSNMPGDTGGFSRFNAAQIAATQEALALWSDVANINFVRVGTGTGSSAYSNNATILFGNYSTGAVDAAAFANYPGSTNAASSAGDVWVNVSLDYNANPVFLEYGQQVLEHEIGHALGLAHPGDYDASNSVDPTYDASAVFWQDARMFTVMSYFGSANTGGSLGGLSNGPQLLDIAAIQRLYGARTTTRTGDTVYGFNSNSGHAHYSIASSAQAAVFSIWDGGGNDTLDLSGYSTNSDIDLRPESFSSAGPGDATSTISLDARYNISIARGVTIENAIGGAGNDTITGNTVANHLTGNGGNDYLDGNAGADTMSGGLGNDTYVVDNAGDVTTENPGEGSDNVYAFISFTLAANVENLILLGSAASGTGNGLNNLVIGDGVANTLSGLGGDDYINGNGGADAMSGGLGNDTFVVDNAGDVTTENSGEGSDNVYSYISWTISSNIENLILLNAAVNGTGNELNNLVIGDDVANTLLGLGGDDYINGNGGADAMSGGLGNDTYVVDSAGDVVTENPGEGSDNVYSYIDYTLGDNLEVLVLLGTAVTATGNEAANILAGDGADNVIFGLGGADYMNGDVGADAMHGGLGNDTYIVDNVGDVTDEASGEGTDLTYAYISWTLAPNVENLVLLGSAASATGNELANNLTGNTLANTFTGGDGDDKFIFRAVDMADGVQDVITDFEAHGGAEDDKISFRNISPSAVTTHDVAGGVEIDIDLGGGHTASILVANQTSASIADDIFFGI